MSEQTAEDKARNLTRDMFTDEEKTWEVLKNGPAPLRIIKRARQRPPGGEGPPVYIEYILTDKPDEMVE